MRHEEKLKEETNHFFEKYERNRASSTVVEVFHRSWNEIFRAGGSGRCASNLSPASKIKFGYVRLSVGGSVVRLVAKERGKAKGRGAAEDGIQNK